MPAGLKVITTIERPPRELVREFAGIPASNISDIMNRFFCMHQYIKAFSTCPMVGTAFTVRVPGHDNMMIHYALDLAEPGDVIVVDGGSAVNRALMGEIMFTYAKKRGLAGIIVDGGIRDVESIPGLELPVYACGVTPQGPYKNGPGEINVPIACGGQVVSPGDILVGDRDGVVVIRREDAAELLSLAQEKLRSEEKRLTAYRRGELDLEQHFAEYDAIVKKLGTTIS